MYLGELLAYLIVVVQAITCLNFLLFHGCGKSFIILRYSRYRVGSESSITILVERIIIVLKSRCNQASIESFLALRGKQILRHVI